MIFLSLLKNRYLSIKNIKETFSSVFICFTVLLLPFSLLGLTFLLFFLGLKVSISPENDLFLPIMLLSVPGMDFTVSRDLGGVSSQKPGRREHSVSSQSPEGYHFPQMPFPPNAISPKTISPKVHFPLNIANTIDWVTSTGEVMAPF